MCRIFCSPDKDLGFVEEDLLEYFYRLEKSLGKDGNGIYNFTTKELWKHHDRMPTEANMKGGILFHTRYATNGLVRDYNCQPFNNKNYVMVHNGTFPSIETHARLLGFPYSSVKYSDTYMMAWVMERTGIFAFYNAFKNKYYGVVLVYDKKTDTLYLLKTGGSFEYGIFECGKYIYGSSLIDYWKIENKAVNMKNGLFILRGDGFTQIHKPKTTTTYSGHNYYQNNWVDNIKKTKKQKKKDKIKKIVSKINKETVDNLINDKNSADIPLGLSTLFPTIIPTECIGCNWVYKRKCWFGGVEHTHPVNVTNPDTKKIICNTKTSTVDILITCSRCNIPLHKDVKWGIVDEEIMCEDCEKDSYLADKECRDCGHYLESCESDPCASCFNVLGIPRNWTEKNNYELCLNCYHENVIDKETDLPCRVCREEENGMSQWTLKNGSHEGKKVCNECGWIFEEWDTPEMDKHGQLVCYECIYEAKEKEEEEEDDDWGSYYEIDYYKNGKWRNG